MTTTDNVRQCDIAAPAHPARLVEYQMNLQRVFPANHPDSELMRLADRLLHLRAESIAACDLLTVNVDRLDALRLKHPKAATDRALDERLATETGVVASEADIDRLSDEESKVVELIIGMPVRTIDGLCVKSMILEHVHDIYCCGAGDEGFETRMIRSVAMSAMSFIDIPAELRRQIEAVMRASAKSPGQSIAA